MKKKLLFISNISFGGLGSFSKASFLAAKELGWEFHMAANFSQVSKEQQETEEKKYGVKIHQINFARNPLHPKNIKAYKQLLTLMKEEQFDVVHCNTPVGGVYGRLAAIICGVKKIIYQAHGFHFYKGASRKSWLIYYPIEKILATFTDVLITINKEDYEKAQTFKLRTKEPIYYVPGVGIETKKIKNTESKRDELLNEVKAKQNSILLMSVGELNDNKNNIVIIEALKKLNNPYIHYLLCGLGNKEKYLKSKVKEYGLDNQVHFLGYREDVPTLLQSIDIFVLPSKREGLSRAIMEAMSAALPCLVSEIRGNKDLIIHGKGGFVHGANNVNEIVCLLRKLVISNKDRFQMGKYNLEKVTTFDIESIKKNILEIYRNMVYEITE